jgi:hypothetical protein
MKLIAVDPDGTVHSLGVFGVEANKGVDQGNRILCTVHVRGGGLEGRQDQPIESTEVRVSGTLGGAPSAAVEPKSSRMACLRQRWTTGGYGAARCHRKDRC